MPSVKVWIHFVYEESRVSEVFRLMVFDYLMHLST